MKSISCITTIIFTLFAFNPLTLASPNDHPAEKKNSESLKFTASGGTCNVELGGVIYSTFDCNESSIPYLVFYSGLIGSANQIWLYSRPKSTYTEDCDADNVQIIAISDDDTRVRALAPIKFCNRILHFDVSYGINGSLSIDPDWIFDGNALRKNNKLIDAVASCRHLLEAAAGFDTGNSTLDFLSSPDDYPNEISMRQMMPVNYTYQTTNFGWYTYDYQKKTMQTPTIEEPQNVEPMLATAIDICKQQERQGKHFKFYEVTASPRAYFRVKPAGEQIPTNAFIVKGDKVIGWDNDQGHIFVEYTDTTGKATRGWIEASDLIETDSMYEINPGFD